MNFQFCGVMTQSHSYLIVPMSWVENEKNPMTKVFYSPERSDTPDFTLPVKYFVDSTKSAVYNAYIMQFMRKCCGI